MKKYETPVAETLIVNTNDVLAASGIEINNSNAGFNIPDETL